MSDKGEYLGINKKGYKYYMRDRYVFNYYPEDGHWVNGRNLAGQLVGWVCSLPVWERTFKHADHIMLA